MFGFRKRLQEARRDAEHNWGLAMAWKRLAEQYRAEAEQLREQSAPTTTVDFHVPANVVPADLAEAIEQHKRHIING